MWAQPCAHVIFDTDPTPRGRNGPAEEEEMSQAMIRSVTETLTHWLLEKCLLKLVKLFSGGCNRGLSITPTNAWHCIVLSLHYDTVQKCNNKERKQNNEKFNKVMHTKL